MELKQAIEILRKHNEWRRGAEIPMTDPKILGEAIDCVVENFDAKYESVAESYETGFAQGQEVGEREMLDKACVWLYNHLGKDNGTPYFIKAFRKAMKE